MISEYRVSSVSTRHSRSSMPSVMYLITVSGDVTSSKRIEYPTSCPSRQPNSSATRLATDMAATRRGCVHAMMPLEVKPASAMYWVIWVVLPLPVSPMTTRIWLSVTALISSCLSAYTGRLCRCSWMVRLREGKPKETALPIDCVFHSGAAS